MNGRAFTPVLICVSPDHQNIRRFKSSVLSTKSDFFFYIQPGVSLSLFIAGSKWDSYSPLSLWTGSSVVAVFLSFEAAGAAVSPQGNVQG